MSRRGGLRTPIPRTIRPTARSAPVTEPRPVRGFDGPRLQPGNTVGRETRFKPGNPHRFEPGRSGNPERQFRPGDSPCGKTEEDRMVQALTQQGTASAARRLAALIESENPRTALAACKAMITLARSGSDGGKAKAKAPENTVRMVWRYYVPQRDADGNLLEPLFVDI